MRAFGDIQPPLCRGRQLHSNPAMILNAPPETRSSSYEGTTLYDSGIIERFADKLYSRAATIVFLYTFVGLIFAAGALFAVRQSFQNDAAGWIAGVVTVAIAFYLGQQRAFQLRLQAQVALCQVQIEKNTRQINSRS
jgi:hypothetical protein